MKFLSINYISSRRDRSGNVYHAFTFTNLITGQSVSGKVGHADNVKHCLYDLCGGDWEVVRAFIDESSTETPIREFDRFVKNLPYVDDSSAAFCLWLFNFGVIPDIYTAAKFICDATGAVLDHYSTDLYLPASPLFVLLDKFASKGCRGASCYGKSTSAKRFTCNITGKLMLDIPFAYTPAWEASAKSGKVLKV